MADKEEEIEEVEEDEDLEEDEEDDEEGEGGKKKKKKKKKGNTKKLLIILLIVILLLGGGGAGVYFSGILEGGGSEQSEEEKALNAPKIQYYDLEEFIVNLNNPGKQVSFLKMVVTLELPNLATKTVVESKMPRIRDTFQIYLRELRNTDLQGSAALHRLREELLLRINKTLEPDEVTDILFKEIIVQ